MTDEPAMQAGSNRLAMLAGAIRERDETARRHIASAFEDAVMCGEWLREAKQALPHGGWLPWLRDAVGIPPRTAQHYIRLASIPADKRATVAHLGVAGAMRALRKHSDREVREMERFLDRTANKIRGEMAKIQAAAIGIRDEMKDADVDVRRSLSGQRLDGLLALAEGVDEPGGMDRLLESVADWLLAASPEQLAALLAERAEASE